MAIKANSAVKIISISLVFFLILVQLIYLLNLFVIFEKGKTSPVQEPGYEFTELKLKLKDTGRVGFITDKDMSPEGNDGKFLEAQYILAPMVLELGNSANRFTIVDSSNLTRGLAMAENIGAVPVHVTPYGKILAEKGH
ncbi:MAG: hypothetical protein A2Z88_07585 [Omnitrophica WOR_2 bacterium GWA2_47_8]|nr:MAG: hypothetical protein A2Z88_07585 [Omnitrophica WOR_2 bacterium GWA2_47_8]